VGIERDLQQVGQYALISLLILPVVEQVTRKFNRKKFLDIFVKMSIYNLTKFGKGDLILN
jgi:hypothetical protein